MVLHRPHLIKAQLIRQFYLLQRIVIHGAFRLPRPWTGHRQLVKKTKFHTRSPTHTLYTYVISHVRSPLQAAGRSSANAVNCIPPQTKRQTGYNVPEETATRPAKLVERAAFPPYA